MIFTTAILKEVKIMNNLEKQNHNFFGSFQTKTKGFFLRLKSLKWFNDEDVVIHPFRVILNKEITDHVRSWRFLILIAIIALTCLGFRYYYCIDKYGKCSKTGRSRRDIFLP